MRYHLVTFFLFCTIVLTAQELTPLSLSGFNADCIYEKGEALASQNPLDKNWLFYSKTIKSSGGLSQQITSKVYNVPYSLASFSATNTLFLTTGNSDYATGTLALVTPTQAELLFVLGISANGEKGIKVTVNYSDGTSEDIQTISFHDWYGAKEESAHWGLGRIDKNSGSYDGHLEFGMFEAIIPVNSAKKVKTINCQAGDGDGSYSSIFAITAAKGFMFAEAAPLFLINNSHLDTQWNWDITTTIDEYVKATLTDNFSRLEKYPSFRFNFEGAVKYRWMKEYYPKEYEKLKGYIAEGRWNPSGGAWDANETMVASSESLLRNLLYGQMFYKNEFGIKGGTDIMLPDCFGFTAALPSIASHCGFTGFHSQKLGWGSAYSYDALPEFGKWKGIDGNEIYCILKPGPYDKTYKENLSFNTGMLADIRENESKYGLKAAFRYTGKSGDRGGALSEEHAEWLEKSVNGNGPVKVQLVSPTEAFDYMKANDKGQYKTVDHELPMRTHGVGCYTSQTMMKYWNRRNELMADAAERSALIADWTGGIQYPHATLTEAWKRVLLHQFHDDLPGTSIPKAYYYSHNDELLSLQDFHRTIRLAVGAVSEKMDTHTPHTPVIVYNPLSIEREDLVEGEINSPHAWKGIRVRDAEGNMLKCQLTRFSEGKQGFIFAGKVPSLGFAVFDIEEANDVEETNDSTFTITDGQMENAKYRVTLNPQTGDIKSIYDKQLSQELLSAPLRLALLPCKSTSWPAWEIPYSTLTATPTYVNNSDGTLHVSVAEDGPLRKSFRIERTRLGSTFVQYIQLTSAGTDERVDVVNEIDWQSKGYLLKLDVTLRSSNARASFDNSLGYIQRGNSTSDFYEYPAHKWVDMTNSAQTYGVSILNDCKYGWDKPANNRLRMSIVYSPEVGDGYTYQALQDIGFNRFTYSVYSHKGLPGNETMWQAERLNSPLMAYTTQKHQGSLGNRFSFANLSTGDVAIRAFKQAEEGNAAIIRFQELSGNKQEAVTVTFPTEIIHAEEVNGLEEHKGAATYNSKTLSFSVGAFGLKTYKIQFATPASGTEGTPSNTPYTCYTCALEYNADVISLNERKYDGNTGTLGHLFPGELLSDTIHSDGITFKMGQSTAGTKNAVQCKGQSITLPEGHKGGKLYLLAFSTENQGTTASFDIDGKKHELTVGYAMGTLGQWGTKFTPTQFRNEKAAFTATHSHHISERKDMSYQFMYLLKYALDIEEGAHTLTLPNASKIYLMSATIAKCPAESVTPLIPSQQIFPMPKDVPSYTASCGEWLLPSSVTASGYTNANEMPKYAADGNPYTKWCDNKSSSKWISYYFGRDVKICQWEIILAATESRSYVAKDMRLQYHDATTNKYVDIDTVTDNEDNHLLRGLTPFVTKRIRLQLDSPEQSGQTARVYLMNFYGTEASGTGIGDMEAELTDGPQVIYDTTGRRVGIAMIREGKLHHPLLPAGIYIVKGKKISIR